MAFEKVSLTRKCASVVLSHEVGDQKVRLDFCDKLNCQNLLQDPKSAFAQPRSYGEGAVSWSIV